MTSDTVGSARPSVKMLRRPLFASYMITMSLTFCTTLRGCECVCSCMNPRRRQFASGFSFELLAIRCLRSSAAHDVNGNPSLKFCPMFAKFASGGSVVGLRFGTIGPPSRPLGGWRLSHVPEKSTFPLGRRGGGALRSGLPSDVRGVSWRTKEGH
ncbi:MAG: hypothetical protein DMG09_09835 [Acidobacteria bacterium]|nr:MAG: hypothetical protein DMG09_09835 [Acidobacteriota bacterium]